MRAAFARPGEFHGPFMVDAQLLEGLYTVYSGCPAVLYHVLVSSLLLTQASPRVPCFAVPLPSDSRQSGRPCGLLTGLDNSPAQDFHLPGTLVSLKRKPYLCKAWCPCWAHTTACCPCRRTASPQIQPTAARQQANRFVCRVPTNQSPPDSISLVKLPFGEVVFFCQKFKKLAKNYSKKFVCLDSTSRPEPITLTSPS